MLDTKPSVQGPAHSQPSVGGRFVRGSEHTYHCSQQPRLQTAGLGFKSWLYRLIDVQPDKLINVTEPQFLHF